MSDGGGISGAGAGAGAGAPWSGVPAYLPPVTSSEPDWAAMAAANDREHRRRRLLKVGGGVLGVLVVGGLVATAVALQKPGQDRHTSAGPAAATAALSPDGSSAAVPPSASPSASAAASASASAGASLSASGRPSATAGRSGSAAAQAPGPGPAQGSPFQLSSNATIGPTDGHNGPTLNLHSSADSYASSSVSVDTNRSFTVSAMIRNNAPTGGRSVISQGGGSYFAFDLGRDYWGPHNQWVFKVQQSAGGKDGTSLGAFSSGNATTGQWTLLTGVYDAGAKTISLYVNGALGQTTPVSGIWQTGGTVQVGRNWYQSQWTDDWDGAIADVQIWNQALPASAVAQLNSTGGVSAGVPAGTSWLLP